MLKDWEAAPVVASGSRVLEGLGRCIVLAVGEHSQQGIIAAMVAGVEEGDDDLRCATNPILHEPASRPWCCCQRCLLSF